MKFKFYVILLLFFLGCSSSVKAPLVEKQIEKPVAKSNILLIAGEGGPSGNMFIKAAETYKKYHGGEIFEVHNGDEFVAVVREFVRQNGQISHLEYFGHGNQVGLYVNQSPGVNGGVYANDPDLNNNYLAGSIYELPMDIFSEVGWIRFNGCNVASGYPEKNSLAQSFANYFDVDVVGPRGPTEFSKNPKTVDPIKNSNYLNPDFNGDVYMVSTYSDKDFVVVKPQKKSLKFEDVREGQSYYEAVLGLVEKGLDLGVKDGKFLPYKNITYKDAQEFCRIALGDAKNCKIEVKDGSVWIRNLKALKMLIDGAGVKLKFSSPWYKSYVNWANEKGILSDDFTDRKWFTRGEMAEMTWKFMQYTNV